MWKELTVKQNWFLCQVHNLLYVVACTWLACSCNRSGSARLFFHWWAATRGQAQSQWVITKCSMVDRESSFIPSRVTGLLPSTKSLNRPDPKVVSLGTVIQWVVWRYSDFSEVKCVLHLAVSLSSSRVQKDESGDQSMYLHYESLFNHALLYS